MPRGAGSILTLNAGSSSLKFAVFSGDLTKLCSGQVEGLGTRPRLLARDGQGAVLDFAADDAALVDHESALAAILAGLGQREETRKIRAIGHRIVHGGPNHAAPCLISPDLLEELSALAPFAPLHQPHNLAGIRAAARAFPDIAQVACFDTAFHRQKPLIHDLFALPRKFYAEGVRRYGFHGLSYEFLLRRLGDIAPETAKGRLILCHLGNGASLCAVREGRPIATSMGFSPLDGLAMGTRSGAIDPAVLLYLMEQQGMSGAAISRLLYRESGLLGLSGLSSDMRELEASLAPQAREAIDYFAARLIREIGGMAALLEGVDAIVFSGGIGENSKAIRAQTLRGMGWLGASLDQTRNDTHQTIISDPASRVALLVVPTDEEWMIASHVRGLEHARPIR